MTLDPARLTFHTLPGTRQPAFNHTLPAGATLNAFRYLLYREDDIPFTGGGPTHTPVGGTRRNNIPYLDRPLEGEFYVSQDLTWLINDMWPSEAFLGDGKYIARMWWRGEQTGIDGVDVISRVATANFTITNSGYPVVEPVMLTRRRLESGLRVRVDVFPAPRIVRPTELQIINLTGDADNALEIDVDIPTNIPNVRYIKIAIYEEEFVVSPNDKDKRPAVFTDDGIGTAKFAEWVLLSKVGTPISGATGNYQRYRIPVKKENLFNANLDNKRFTAFVRYADAREGNYRSSEVDYVSFTIQGSNAPSTYSAPIIFDTPTYLTRPVIEAAPPNPIFIEQDENWVLNFNYLSAAGLRQKELEVRYTGDTTKATALGSGATAQANFAWNVTNGIPTSFKGYENPTETEIRVQTLPVTGHPSDTLNSFPNTRVGLTEQIGGELERRYFNIEARARDVADTWSNRNDGTSLNPPPLRAYFYRRLRVSRVAVTPVAMPLTQRNPSFANGVPTNGYISIEADIAHATLAHQQDTGNWPEFIKLAWYRQSDVDADGNPIRRPFAYTSDYLLRPGFEEESVEFAVSQTGAEWVPCNNVLNNRTGTNLFEAIRDDAFPMRFGAFIAEGGNPLYKTFGGIHNGTHLLRADLLDAYGGRSTYTLAQYVTVNLPEVRTITPTPNVYDRDHNIVPGSEDVKVGFYIGLTFSEENVSTKGLASYLEVERREVDSDGNVLPGTWVKLPGRVRPDTNGSFGIYRDWYARNRALNQYRVRSVRNPGTDAYSDWTT